jgi:two-component system response regulator GlrR
METTREDAAAMPHFVGTSHVFQATVGRLRRYAPVSATVLIQGETGTGKELAARALHYGGPRARKPFIPVNCGALPDSLLESELFGHARGAFTDAREARKGVIALAEGGTIFLDEIEALSQRAQVVLLRFLQDRSYRALGAGQEQIADVRIVAASNQEMSQLVKQRVFREDLLYRLAVITLTLPPLRARQDDVYRLAEYFVARFAKQYGTKPKRLSSRFVDFLARHHWPGNVRELENLIHRSFLETESDILELVEDRPVAMVEISAERQISPISFRAAKAKALALFEREFIASALQNSDGNVTLAAQLVGKERRSFGKLLKKHGIDKQEFVRRL